MKLILTSDLHQRISKWRELVAVVHGESPRFVLIAGDILPKASVAEQKAFFQEMRHLLHEMRRSGRVTVLTYLGNDDAHVLEPLLDELEHEGLCINLNGRVHREAGLIFCGMNRVRDYPFGYKHWCVRDGDFIACPQQFCGQGLEMDGHGAFVPLDDLVVYLNGKPSLSDELDRLRGQLRAGEVERSVWMVHQPPSGLSSVTPSYFSSNASGPPQRLRPTHEVSRAPDCISRDFQPLNRARCLPRIFVRRFVLFHDVRSWHFPKSEKAPGHIHNEFYHDALGIGGELRASRCPIDQIGGRLQDVIPAKHDVLRHLHSADGDAHGGHKGWRCDQDCGRVGVAGTCAYDVDGHHNAVADCRCGCRARTTSTLNQYKRCVGVAATATRDRRPDNEAVNHRGRGRGGMGRAMLNKAGHNPWIRRENWRVL